MNRRHAISLISTFMAFIGFLFFAMCIRASAPFLATICLISSLALTFFSGYEMAGAENEEG